MKKYITVREATEELNVPIQTIQSWIETEIIHETDKGLPWTQFVDNMSQKLKEEMAILQQQTLSGEED